MQFGTASGTLIIYSGAVFIGNVVADSALRTCRCSPPATTGTLSGLGSQFTGFSTLIEDTSANWIFKGANMQEGTVLLAGFVENDATISGDKTFTAAMARSPFI